MRTLTTRFLIPAMALAVLFSAFVLYRTYRTSRDHVIHMIDRQSELALQFDLAIRDYIGQYVRPEMESRVGKDEFYPETMSTSFVARAVFDKVRKELPDYVLKFSSSNPRNPDNLAGPEELEMIAYFEANPNTEKWAGPINMNGRPYFARFQARRLKPQCMRCHGDPRDAPAQLIERYGPTAGFNRTVGSVMALDTVAIPLDKARTALTADLIGQSAAILAGLAVFFTAVIVVFRFVVSRRLALIAAHFRDIADHAEAEAIQPVLVKGNDEIRALADAFNVLARKFHDSQVMLERRVMERTCQLLDANDQLQHRNVDLEEIGRALSESQRALSTLLSNMPGMAYRCRNDDKWTMEFVSEGSYELTGYHSDELAHNRRIAYAELIHPDDRAEVQRQVQLALADKRPFRLTYRIVTATGREKWVWEQGVGVFARDGRLLALEGFICDISDRKRAEAELEHAKDAADAANRAKSAFLANMSHEIRTPMTAILGYADVLLESGCPDQPGVDSLDAVRTIKRNGEHLLSVINDILDLSKIEAGRLAIERIPCSPCRLVGEVVSLMRVRAEAKGLPLNVEYHGPIPETIQTDPTRLRQVLVNLLGNAIKFTEVGEVRMVVEYRVLEKKALMQFDVIDTGIGMSPDQVDRLFHSFVQADASTTREYGGTGLGLAISRRLAEMLGGAVCVVDTRPGAGTRFRVTVDAGASGTVRMMSDPQSTACMRVDVNAESGAVESRALAGCRILLAEDGPDNQRLIAHLLRTVGAEVIVAENGLTAIEKIRGAERTGQPFHAVLMDMQMPVMDGYEAARSLRSQGYTGRIIALTAHAMTGDRQRCIDAGCDDYAVKPVDRKRLVEIILAGVPSAST